MAGRASGGVSPRHPMLSLNTTHGDVTALWRTSSDSPSVGAGAGGTGTTLRIQIPRYSLLSRHASRPTGPVPGKPSPIPIFPRHSHVAHVDSHLISRS